MSDVTATYPQIGAELAGYRVERLLGRGGMSVVYLAEDLSLRRKVALKLLAPELSSDERFRERFLRESRLAASLDHQNVIPIYEAGDAEGLLFIAMRYVEGTDLKSLLDEERALEPARALSLLLQVASALDAAHEHGLIHRDVKPGNVLVAADGHVYLSDFGLTKQTASESGLTETGQFMGTADYVSPEQVERRAASPRSDQYSLACVLYECLAGEAPYRSESLMGVLFAHVNAPIPSLHARRPELPAGVDPVIGKGMAKSPDERYGSCRELVEEARRELGITGELALPPTGAPAFTRKRLLIAGGALAVAAGAAVPALLLTRGNGSQAAPPLVIEPISLVRVDPATAEPVAVVKLAVAEIVRLAVGAGAVWASSFVDGTVTRIDTTQAAKTLTVSTGGSPRGLAFGEGAVWVVSLSQGVGALTAIDPATGRVRREFALTHPDPTDVAAGLGAVWVTAYDLRGNVLLRILPATGEAVATIPLPARPGRMAVGEGAVWVLPAWAVNAVPAQVWRVDPEANAVVATIETGAAAVAVGEGSVWAAGGPVARIDPVTNRIAARTELDAPVAWEVAVGEGAVWVTTIARGELSRIDPATNRVTATLDYWSGAFEVPAPLAAGPEGVWVGVVG